MSEKAKEKFLQIQAELNKYIANGEKESLDGIDHSMYEHLNKVFSELRTPLTIDLMSRERYKS